jgi:hypothetical protein
MEGWPSFLGFAGMPGGYPNNYLYNFEGITKEMITLPPKDISPIQVQGGCILELTPKPREPENEVKQS